MEVPLHNFCVNLPWVCLRPRPERTFRTTGPTNSPHVFDGPLMVQKDHLGPSGLLFWAVWGYSWPGKGPDPGWVGRLLGLPRDRLLGPSWRSFAQRCVFQRVIMLQPSSRPNTRVNPGQTPRPTCSLPWWPKSPPQYIRLRIGTNGAHPYSERPNVVNNEASVFAIICIMVNRPLLSAVGF